MAIQNKSYISIRIN